MKTAKFFLLVLASAFGCASASVQQFINFDDVADKTDIRSQYQGLTFSCDGAACALGNKIFARATATTASLPNSVAPIETGVAGVRDSLTGRIRIDLADPASAVSVDARGYKMPEALTTQHAMIIAQDGMGNTLGQAVGTQFGTFETLAVTASGNQIARVYLGVENAGTAAVAQFDNLRIDRELQFLLPLRWWIVLAVLLFVSAGLYAWWRSRSTP